MGEVQHRAVDGSVFRLVIPGSDLPFKYTCDSEFMDGGKSRALCAGPPGHTLDVANEADFGVVEFEQEYSFLGGTIRIGSSPLVDSGDGAYYFERDAEGNTVPMRRWLLAWEGRSSAFHTQQMGVDRSAFLLNFINRLSMHETTDGLVLDAIDGDPVVYNTGPSLVKWVPRLGIIESFQLNSRALSKVPRWAGTTVRYGELFLAHSTEDDHYFVHLSRTALTWIIPSHNVLESTVLQIVSEMQADWTGPS